MTENSEINSKLDALLSRITELDKKIDVHMARDEQTAEIAHENRRTLMGYNGQIGLVAIVEKNSKAIDKINTLLWTIATPLIIAIGAGLVMLIAESVSK